MKSKRIKKIYHINRRLSQLIWCYHYQAKKTSKHKELPEIEKKKKNHDKCEISYKDTETLNKYRTKNRGSNWKYKKGFSMKE